MLIEDATTTRCTGLSMKLLKQHGRSVVVNRDVAIDGVHALTDTNLGGEVDNFVYACQRAADRVAVTDIRLDEFYLSIEPVASTVGVDLCD